MEQSLLEGIAFSARLTATRFFGKFLEIAGERAWTAWWNLTWGKDVLEPGERCAEANRRRAGEGRDDHAGTPFGATADWGCDDLRGAPLPAPSSRSSATTLWPGGRKFEDNQRRMCGTSDLTSPHTADW